MAISVEKVIHNLHFDRLFLDKIEAAEKTSGKKLHANGLPFHYLAVFKVLLCMPEEKMKVEIISDTYRRLFGRNINQSSLSRTLNYLNEQLGLVAEKKNPHVDARFSWVKLTNAGKKFQKHLIGSTTVDQPYAPEMRKVINIGRS